MTNPFIVLSLVAGLLAVDERAGWQSLLSQPVFAALLVGVFMGDIQTAIMVGVVLELIYLSILPMRGLRRPDHVASAVVGAGTAILLMQWTADPRTAFIVAVGILAGLVAGELGAKLTAPFFGLQNRYLSRVGFSVDATRRQTSRRLFWLHSGSTAYIFVVEASIVFLLLNVSYNLTEKFTRLTAGSFVDGASHWSVLMPALGAASLIHLYWHQHLKRVLILTTVLVIAVLWLR